LDTSEIVTGDSVSSICGGSANVSTQVDVVFKPCLATSASTNLPTDLALFENKL